MVENKYKNLMINTISRKTSNIEEDILVNPVHRKGFAHNDKLMVTPIYFYRFIGADSIETYESWVKDLDERLSDLKNLYIRLEKGFEKVIDISFITEFNRSWGDVEKLPIKNSKNIVEKTQPLFPKVEKTKLNLLKEKTELLLDIYIKNQPNINITKNFYIKILFWLKKHIENSFDAYVYGEDNPKLLYIGDIQKDEIYFLILLSMIGFDIVYLNPQNNGKFNEVPESSVYSHEVILGEYKDIELDFSKVSKERLETVAYKASREIEKILHTEDSGMYSPWQFEHYEVIAQTIKTTLEELLIIWDEEARFREGFKIENGKVLIPNVFGKISGTCDQIEDYYKMYSTLAKESPMKIFVGKIPFTTQRGYAASPGIVNFDGTLNKEKIKSLPEYKFHHLRLPVQNMILNAIEKLIIHKEDIFNFSLAPNFSVHIIYTILGLEKKYLDIIQKFDYPFEIPKLVIFDTDEKIFNKEDLIVISFLHFIGFDVVILTPTGYNNIESGIRSGYYDIHKLKELRFDLSLEGMNSKLEREVTKKKGFFGFFTF